MEKSLTFHQQNSSFGVFHPLRVLKFVFYLPKKSASLNPLKMIKNAFNFILETFRSQDIEIFVLAFWSCRKNGFIRTIRLISKFMTSQPG